MTTLRGAYLAFPVALLLALGLAGSLAGALAGDAQALERKAQGDVLVPEGAVEEEVRTGWGDVVVRGRVEGDVSSGLGDVRVYGPVGGDVETVSGDVAIDARVGGDVRVGTGNLYLGRDARVGIVSVGNGRFDHHPGAEYVDFWAANMSPEGYEDEPPEAAVGLVGHALVAALFAAVSVLLAVVAPRPMRASAGQLEGAPGRALLVGLGSVPAIVVLCLALAITGVGLLLLPLLLPAYLALVLFGAPVAAYALGRRLLLATGRYRAGDAVAAAVGALVVVVLSMVPYLGGILVALFVLAGAGAVLLALLSRRGRLRRPGAWRGATVSPRQGYNGP